MRNAKWCLMICKLFAEFQIWDTYVWILLKTLRNLKISHCALNVARIFAQVATDLRALRKLDNKSKRKYAYSGGRGRRLITGGSMWWDSETLERNFKKLDANPNSLGLQLIAFFMRMDILYFVFFVFVFGPSGASPTDSSRYFALQKTSPLITTSSELSPSTKSCCQCNVVSFISD